MVRNQFRVKAIEIPATWRYNILKNKKLQPYISISTTFRFPIHADQMIYFDNNSSTEIKSHLNESFGVYFDVGLGLNYRVKNWIFNIQPTFRPSTVAGDFGVNMSVIFKF